jgi:hypothetical protein
MSIGNTKDQGNKGNNFPYQLRTLQLLSSINDGISALPGIDHESRTSTYEATCTICGPGYSNGDIIIRYDIIDLATGLIDATIWFNDTLQTQITPDPAPGDLTPISAPSGVTVLNGPGINAVNIQDGGNSITVDANNLDIRNLDFASDSVDISNSTNVGVTNSNLDVALSTLGKETTLTNIYNNVFSKIERIKGSANYNRAITYVSAGTGDFRINNILHTGTTLLGAETLTETFTYYLTTDNVTNIQYT